MIYKKYVSHLHKIHYLVFRSTDGSEKTVPKLSKSPRVFPLQEKAAPVSPEALHNLSDDGHEIQNPIAVSAVPACSTSRSRFCCDPYRMESGCKTGVRRFARGK